MIDSPCSSRKNAEMKSSLLLSLPQDVLLMVILQESIGARELCHLEVANTVFRKIIDDNVWKHAFLHHRHCNAIHEPVCWKNEFARRDAWSHGWRHLIESSPVALRFGGPVSAHTLKLRRLALKMVSVNSLLLLRTKQVTTHVVDASGHEPGSFRTIREAVAKAQAFDRVLIKPGIYLEKLKLDKSVEIVGTGKIGSTVIDGVNGCTVEVSSRVSCRLANLCIEQRPKQAEAVSMSSAVLVKGSATVIVEECSISSMTGHCVVVQGAESKAYILHNVIHDAKGVGVLICDHARGVIEDNIIFRNGRAGVAILSEGDPLVRENKIHDGLDSGVLVSEKGRGRIENNDIFGNRRAGVAILKEGAPLVQQNRIHNGRDSGVLICENGKGAVVNNDIFANEMAGVAIGRGGASQITGNTIRDGNGGSLCLSVHSKGLISANVIHQDPRAEMQVPDPLLSELKERNDIRYDVDLAV